MKSYINEEYADYVLSISKNGLNDLVRDIRIDAGRLKVDLQPDLIEKFNNKFPDVDLNELDKTVEWILIMSRVLEQNNE